MLAESIEQPSENSRWPHQYQSQGSHGTYERFPGTTMHHACVGLFLTLPPILKQHLKQLQEVPTRFRGQSLREGGGKYQKVLDAKDSPL